MATKRKTYIGKVTNFFTNIGVAEIKVETDDLKIGDEIQITGPTTGVYVDVLTEIRVNEKFAEKAEKGVFCSIPVKSLVRRMDKVFRVEDVGSEEKSL